MKRISLRGIKSYVSSSGSYEALTNTTIPEQFRLMVEKFPSKAAMTEIIKRKTFTFTEVEEHTNNIAANLISLGLNKGDRIGVYGVNHYEWIATQIAAAKAGLILVCINPAYQPREMRFAFNKVGLKAIVSDTSYGRLNFAKTLSAALDDSGDSLEHVIFFNQTYKQALSDDELENWNNRGRINTSCLNDLMTGAESSDLSKMEDIIKHQDADEACNIQFTSGTTGNPKGATLSHHNLLNNNKMVWSSDYATATDDSKTLLLVPMYHSSGCAGVTMTTLNLGATIIAPAPHFDPKMALNAFEEYKCDLVIGVPTMYLDMIDLVAKGEGTFGDHKISAFMGGAICPPALRQRLAQYAPNMDLSVVYGTTENSPVTFGTPLTASQNIRDTTVGFVFPHTEAKVVNVTSNEIVERETIGEICIRGYCVFKGYWNDEEKTRETVDKDNWYHTGDLGYLTEEGGLVVTGRSKEMIIRGGENIYPAEIENIMIQIDQVRLYDRNFENFKNTKLVYY